MKQSFSLIQDFYVKQYKYIGHSIIFAVVMLISLFLWQMSLAQTATVSATITASNLAVSVVDGSIAFGTVSLNTATTTAGNSDTQTVTNDGSTAQMNVKTEDSTGGVVWAVGTSPGTNIYQMEVSTTTGSTYMTFQSDNTYLTASSSMTTLLTDTLDFRLTTPTASDDFVEKTITITVQVTSL